MSNSDVVEESTKISIIKNATGTNSLTLSGNDLVFNEIVNANTINEKMRITPTQISIDGSPGTNGQVLTSDGTTTSWEDPQWVGTATSDLNLNNKDIYNINDIRLNGRTSLKDVSLNNLSVTQKATFANDVSMSNVIVNGTSALKDVSLNNLSVSQKSTFIGDVSMNNIVINGTSALKDVSLNNFSVSQNATFIGDVSMSNVLIPDPINNKNPVSKQYLNTTLQSYATTAAVNTSFVSYATTAAVNTSLESYATTAAVNTSLASYPTNASLATNYATTSTLNTTLQSYATSAAVNTSLASYANKNTTNTFAETITMNKQLNVTDTITTTTINTGRITVNQIPVNSNELVSKAYVDSLVGQYSGGLNLFFNYSDNSDITGYSVLSKSINNNTNTQNNKFSITTNGNFPICSFITDANYPGIKELPKGIWNMTVYGDISSNIDGNIQYYFNLKKYGSATPIVTSSYSEDVNTLNVAIKTAYYTQATVTENLTLTLTDRIIVELCVYVSGLSVSNNNLELTTYFEKDCYSYIQSSLNEGTNILSAHNTWTANNDFNITPRCPAPINNVDTSYVINIGYLNSGIANISTNNLTVLQNATFISDTSMNNVSMNNLSVRSSAKFLGDTSMNNVSMNNVSINNLSVLSTAKFLGDTSMNNVSMNNVSVLSTAIFLGDTSMNNVVIIGTLQLTNCPITSATVTNDTSSDTLITKSYVDNKTSGKLDGSLTSPYTWTGQHTFDSSYPTTILTADPTLDSQFVTKKYVDTKSAGSVTFAGINPWTGTNSFNNSYPTTTLTADPTLDGQFVTKKYVDSKSAGSISLGGINPWTGINSFTNLPTTTETVTTTTPNNAFVTKQYVDDNTAGSIKKASPNIWEALNTFQTSINTNTINTYTQLTSDIYRLWEETNTVNTTKIIIGSSNIANSTEQYYSDNNGICYIGNGTNRTAPINIGYGDGFNGEVKIASNNTVLNDNTVTIGNSRTNINLCNYTGFNKTINIAKDSTSVNNINIGSSTSLTTIKGSTIGLTGEINITGNITLSGRASVTDSTVSLTSNNLTPMAYVMSVAVIPGTIITWPTPNPPGQTKYDDSTKKAYLLCDGTPYLIADYLALSNILLLDTQFQVSGDATRFKVPNYMAKFLVGATTAGIMKFSGNYTGGDVSQNINIDNIPPHSHKFSYVKQVDYIFSSGNNPNGNGTTRTTAPSGGAITVFNISRNDAYTPNVIYDNITPNVVSNTANTASSKVPLPTLPPYNTIFYFIKT